MKVLQSSLFHDPLIIPPATSWIATTSSTKGPLMLLFRSFLRDPSLCRHLSEFGSRRGTVAVVQAWVGGSGHMVMSHVWLICCMLQRMIHAEHAQAIGIKVWRLEVDCQNLTPKPYRSRQRVNTYLEAPSRDSDIPCCHPNKGGSWNWYAFLEVGQITQSFTQHL